MIHPTDEAVILCILGVQKIPEKIEYEYKVRQRMMQISGASGPFLPAMIIDMLRFLGYKPEDMQPIKEKVDWSKQPTDGTCLVEAKFYGDWIPGVFIGFIENGTLGVKLDNDAIVRECRPDMVRLCGIKEPKPEPPPAAALLYELSAKQADVSIWDGVEVGAPVLIDGPELLSGSFVGVEGDQVRVEYKGEESLYSPEVVTPG